MFIILRRIERWLHQHIFKVGWLSTHNYQTTTILYYTFFMPGVILHEVVYYLAAGIANVRAERQIKWPDEQEVGELKLNFVKLAPRTSAFRKAVITSAPLLVGLVCVWLISNNIFNITEVVNRMSSGELTDIGAAFNLLFNAPLFWLWIYIIFTIANTMFPTVPKDLRGWRSVMIGLGVVAVALLLVGIGGEIFEALQTPLNTIILVLTQTFILLICVDLLMVLALGLIEYTIERITGHSATFRGNKMYTMTREEALEEREKQRERKQRRQEREQRRREAQVGGIQTIYAMAFEIPGAPGDTPITQLDPMPNTDETPEKEATPTAPAASMPLFGGLSDDAKPTETVSEETRQQREAIGKRINLPSRAPAVPEVSTNDTEDDKDSGIEPATSPAASRPPVSAPMFAPDDTRLEEAEDETDEKPSTIAASAASTSRFGSRLGQSTSNDDKQADKPITSRFGATPTTTSNDTDSDKPAASTSRFGSRFGQSTSDDDKQADKPTTSRFGGTPSPTSDDTDSDKPAASTSRFGSRFGQSTSDDDKQADKPTQSRFGATPSPTSDDTDSDKPAASTSRFGSRFGQSTSDDDKDEVEETVRIVGRPASPSRIDDEEDESLDESIARRGRGDDAVTSLFGQLGNDSAEDEEDEQLSSSKRFGSQTSSRFGSRFGSLSSRSGEDDTEDDDEKLGSRFRPSRPTAPFAQGGSPLSPIGASSDDDNQEDDDDESIVSSSSFRRPSARPSARFGSSRPAPKPSFAGNDDDEEYDDDDESVSLSSLEDIRSRGDAIFGRPTVDNRPAYKPSVSDDEEDEIVYEDVDEYDYVDIDDESYVDYDDDEYIDYDDD